MNHPITRIMGLPGALASTFSQGSVKEGSLPPLCSTPPKESKYLPFDPAGIPQALRDHPHWLVSGTGGRPVRRQGVGDSKTTPAHWADFAKVAQIATGNPELWPYIVLTDETAFTVFDVDFKPRREHETEEVHAARITRAESALDRLREMFPARYESKSKSGKGYHLIVKGKFDGANGKGKDEWEDVEIYTRGHGIALTGHVLGNHDNPAEYPAEMLQSLRDEIKGGAPPQDWGEDIPDRRRRGSVPLEWARDVLLEVDRLHGGQLYPDWLKIASPVFDGLGVEEGIELLKEVWPEKKLGEYKRLADSLEWFKPWCTLNEYLKGSDLEADEPFQMPDMSGDDGDEQAIGESPTVEAFPIVRAGMSEGLSDAADFVEDLLTDGGASVVYGPSNCGKSFWILDVALSVATGMPFRGNMEVDQGAVVYVALEGSQGVKNRIEALKREGRLPTDTPLFICYAPVSLMEKKHVPKLAQAVKNAAEQSALPCRLVILDTLARAMAGGDENSGKDMGVAVKSMDAIRRATGAHVCLIHHCGKDEARGARGHSSLRAAIDTEIEITRPEGVGISTVRATKQRDLPSGDAMPFSLKVITLGMNRRGKPITSCVVQHEHKDLAIKPGKAGRKPKASPEDLLRYLPCATVTEWKERVREEAGLGESQFYAHKKVLETAGKVCREVGTGRILPHDPQTALPDLMDEI